MIKICDGLHPPTANAHAPKGYIKLMQECWNSDPNKRLSSYYIRTIFRKEIIPNYNGEIMIVKSLDIGTTITNNSDTNSTISTKSLSSSEQGN